MNAPALEAAYRASAGEPRKFRREEIPAVTQLFTPGWVAEFLLHNTLGRLWLDMHPDSGLPPALAMAGPDEDAESRATSPLGSSDPSA